MSTATRSIPASLTSYLASPKQLLIGGQWQPAASGKTFEVINPANEAVISHVAHGADEDIALAVKSARNAFDDGPWNKINPSQRGKLR